MKILFLLFFPLCVIAGENPVHIIPEPAQVVGREGFFMMNKPLKVFISATDSAFVLHTKRFFDEYARRTGVKYAFVKDSAGLSKNLITVSQASVIQKEGYRLD